DLDLTLLDDEHKISPRNHTAVRRCVELGAKVVITSGRMFSSTLPYLRALDLHTPMITYNGAFIKHPDTGAVLLHECLAADTAMAIVDFCAHENLNLNFYLNDTLYIAKINPWAELYSQRTGAKLHPVGDLRTFAGERPTKVLIVDDPQRIARLYDELAPQYADRAYVTISNVEYLEFMPPGVDKGKALAVVANHFGIPQEKTIAFGDAGNDVPLIRWAGLGVAMENAKDEAKAVADRVALRYDEDGVAVVLEELFNLCVHGRP
ncbi:MAG TPA: Cof-type HAD-IIB family hydrolase, partial [Armatimonadota bacterium]